MARYAASHQTAVGGSLTIINITGGTAIRLNVYDIVIGFDATPADIATEFSVARTDDAGTGGSALAEVALDPITVAATGAAVGGTFGAEPTYTSNAQLLMIAMNQRATFRWVAAPGGELISAAASGDGIGLRSVASGATPNCNATMHWYE